MANKIEKREIDLEVKVEGADEAGSTFDKLGDKIKDIAAGALTLFGVDKLIEFGKKALEVFGETQKAADDLKYSIMNINGQSKESYDVLIKSNEKLSKSLNNVYSTKQLAQAQTQLATFGLTSKQIEKLTPQILDYAAATGQDLTSATENAIKAIGGHGKALKDVGIVMGDTGSKTQNLSVLEEKFAKFTGKASDELNTQASQTASLSNNMEDLESNIGKFIASTGLTKWLAKIAGGLADILKTGEEIRKEADETVKTQADADDIAQIDEEVGILQKHMKDVGKSDADIKKATNSFVKGELDRMKATSDTIDKVSKKYGIIVKDTDKIADDSTKTEKAHGKTLKEIKEDELKDLKAKEETATLLTQEGSDDRLTAEKNAADEQKTYLDKNWKALGLTYNEYILEKTKLDTDYLDKKKTQDAEQQKQQEEAIKKSEELFQKGLDKKLARLQEAADKQLENDTLTASQRDQIESDLLAKEKQAELDYASLTGADTTEINKKYDKLKLTNHKKYLKDKKDEEKSSADAANALAQQGADAAQSLLDTGLSANKANAKAQFEVNKAFSLASAIVSGTEAIVKAATPTITPLGPVVNPVVLGVTIASVAANLAKIAATQFTSTNTSTSSGAGGGSGGASAPSTSNFTPQGLQKVGGQSGFNNPNNPQAPKNGPQPKDAQKVYVVASDISTSQNKNAILSKRGQFNR